MMKKALCIITAAALLAASAASVYAATPEFGKTQEQWDRLRDNTLEFDEIDDLIHEYNPTVKNNAADLKEFKKNYGTTNDEVSQSYSDMAAQLRESINVDDTDPMYAMNAMGAVTSDAMAKQMEQQADNTLEDYEVNRLNYEMAEKKLVQSAKANMIAVYTDKLSAQNAKLNVELLESQLEIKKAQASTGTGTQVDVLKATEDLLNAKKTSIQADAAVDTAKKKLQIACGWKYTDEPVIGSLPEPDFARIDTMNPDADLQTALNNNYTLRVNKRKLSNAKYQTAKDTMETTIADNEQSIGLALKTAYLTAVAAKDAYDYAVAADRIQQQTLTQTEKSYEAGNASKFELDSQKITAQITKLSVEQAKYAVLEALMNYDYAVAGLADSGSM